MASTIKKILGYTLIYSFMATCSGTCSYTIAYNLLPENRAIEYTASRKQIEGLVKLVETPKESFDVIDKIFKIKFTRDHDEVNFTRDRWCSLIETYSLGTGDCDDGAIAFSAMLSDKPQYKTWFVWLLPPEKSGYSGHAIAIFKDGNKYGYASFNHLGFLKNYNVFKPAEYNSIDELISNFYSGDYEKYSLIKFNEEDLKFGRALQKNYKDLEWKIIK